MNRPPDPPAPAASAPGQARPGWSLARRRWPVALGAIVLLALALVTAWLLRPGPPDTGLGEPAPAAAPAPASQPVVSAPGDASAPAAASPDDWGAQPPDATAAAPRAAVPVDDAGTVDEEGMDDAPPATVDSPQARRAWLERIRELRDAGELEAARASLGEYRRRYPGADLPGDLQGLLSE